MSNPSPQAYEFVDFVNNYLDRLVIKLEKKKTEYLSIHCRNPVTGTTDKLYLYLKDIQIQVFGDGDTINAIRQLQKIEQKGDQKVTQFFDAYVTNFLITKPVEEAADKFIKYVYQKAIETKTLPKTQLDSAALIPYLPPDKQEEAMWNMFERFYRIGNEKKDSSERYPSQISLNVPMQKNSNRFRDGVEIIENPLGRVINTNNWFVKRNQVCNVVLFNVERFRLYKSKFTASCDLKRVETVTEGLSGPIVLVPPIGTLTPAGIISNNSAQPMSIVAPITNPSNTNELKLNPATKNKEPEPINNLAEQQPNKKVKAN